MFTPQDKIITYKNYPIQVYILLNLNTMCHFLDDPQLFLCFVIVVHESIVDPEQLNCLLFFRKILQLLHILWFSSIFCIFEPFPSLTVWFWNTSFNTEDYWGTHVMHNYYKRWKHILRLKKATQCIKRRGCSKLFKLLDQGNLYLLCLLGKMSTCKYLCSFWSPVFWIYTSSSCSKVYIPRLLMPCVAFFFHFFSYYII